METIVDERGVKLSSGQRQRIVLVQEALEKLMEGRTTIVIAPIVNHLECG